MKIVRKIVCALLSVVLLFTMVVPSFAASNDVLATTHQLSANNSLEIKYKFVEDSKEANRKNNTKRLESFTVSQYYNGELLQIITGTPGGDRLSVTNYEKGIATGTETIMIADRVQVCDSSLVENSASNQTRAGQESIGYITYKPTIESGTTHRIRVYSEQTGHDRRSYVINGRATDTVGFLTSLVISLLSAIFVPTYSVAQAIVVAIVTGVGGSIAAETIGVAFSEPVSVDAYDYTLTGYDYNTGRYTLGYDGTANQVKTVNSNYYNQWFYDGFTPDNWRNNSLAYWFWCDLFSETYPQVKSYS